MNLRCIVAALLCLLALASCRGVSHYPFPSATSCFANATWQIVESIPMGVNATPVNVTTTASWLDLIGNAQYSIDIASYYWTLSNGSSALGGDQGRAVYQALIDAHTQRNVQIRIVQQEADALFPDLDSQWLADNGIATVRNINWTGLMNEGILHTKMFIIDQRHVYIGSANMDWASLTQVKELGMVVKECPIVADDARHIFDMYFDAANKTALPAPWPSHYDTKYNEENPMRITLSDTPVSTFIASSPDQFCTPHRTRDIDAVVNTMKAATQTVCISVMDYLPCTLYMSVASQNFYWGVIDETIRIVAFKGIQVQLLVSHWNYTSPEMYQYVASLNQLTNVQVRFYTVPGIPNQFPYTRVNHAKYMVTDQAAYIGTSNWTGDYYVYTGGVSITSQNADIRAQLQAVFDRDWNSVYASPVNNTNTVPSATTSPPALALNF